MNILITGATGFVGHEIISNLSKQLSNSQISITIISRKTSCKEFENIPNIKFITWDEKYIIPKEQLSKLIPITHVINLVGENISNKRWSEEQKKKIYDSRINATTSLIQALNENSTKLEAFIQTSAIGIYEANTQEALNESSKLANNYLADVCKKWESTLNALSDNVRKVIFRVGVVLDKSGGALAKMHLPFMLGLGGNLGNGKQMMSWIHRKDLADLYIQACQNNKFEGIYNAVAPQAISNEVFTKTIGKIIHRPTLFPVPKFILNAIFGEMSCILLDSVHVTPDRLLKQGYTFLTPTIESAIKEIYPSR